MEYYFKSKEAVLREVGSFEEGLPSAEAEIGLQ